MTTMTTTPPKHELPKKLNPKFYLAFEGRLTQEDLAQISEFDFGCQGKDKIKIEVDKEKINDLVATHGKLPWASRNTMIQFVKLLYLEIGPYGMPRLAKHLIQLCHSRRKQDMPFCGAKPEFWRQFDMKSKELGTKRQPETECEGDGDVSAKRQHVSP